MSARLALSVVALLALLGPALARADVGVYLSTRTVPAGGLIAGWGDGSRMPLYLVAADKGLRRHICHGDSICEPTVSSAPGKPFVFLGRLRRTTSPYTRQSFGFPTPEGLRPGLYRLYLYCRLCGGSLIQSGSSVRGQTLRITPRPLSRNIRVGAGPARARFLVSQPAGVILLLRLTVPHGTRAYATGTIPGLARVAISTDDHSQCERRGAYDTCTQPEEWCPMPAAAWRFLLHKVDGPAGKIKLEFVIGAAPTNP